MVVPAIRLLADTFMSMVQMLRELGLLDEFKKSPSAGAAVRAASYGSIEDIGKRTTLAALQTGMASADPQNQMLAEQRRTNEFLSSIKGLIETAKAVANIAPETAASIERNPFMLLGPGPGLLYEAFR